VTGPRSDTVDRILVELPATEEFRSVARLVLGGVASRFDLPVDRVEELLLAVESILLQQTDGDVVTLDVAAAPDSLRVRVGPFAELRLDDPAIARVLSRLVDDVSEQEDDGDGTWIELAVFAAWLQDVE
jgi:hypothetical protein